MPQTSANGIQMNYELAGPDDAPILVLVNGLADDLTTWSYQMPALTAKYRVLSYDNRGIGKTSRPKGPYTADLLADDLYELLQVLKITRFHLLGLSMGGMIVQAFALRYPNSLVEGSSSSSPGQTQMLSLSMCCTYAQPTGFCTTMFANWAEIATAMSVRAVMENVLPWAFTLSFFQTRGERLAEIQHELGNVDLDTDTFLAQLNVIQKFDSMGQLDELRKADKVLGNLLRDRILVLYAEQDILIPVQLSRELADMVGVTPRSTSGGHACMWEFPDEFNAAILQFLTECA